MAEDRSEIPGVEPAPTRRASVWPWLTPGSLSALALLLAYVLVWPVGDYPIDDEWAFARALQNLLETGEVRILDWNPMTLVAHLFWGAAFSLPFGFSFTVARLSTVLLLALEVWAILALLEEMGVNRTSRTLASLLVIFQPVHFFQSFQYATDIPSIAWTCVALCGYVKGIRRGQISYAWLTLGSLCGGFAFAVRQPGILVVLAFAAYLLLYERSRSKDARLWLASFAIPVAVVAWWAVWYFRSHLPTAAFRQSSLDTLAYLTHAGIQLRLRDAYFLIATLTAFVLPLALSVPPACVRLDGRRRLAFAAISGALVLLAAWVTFRLDLLFPYVRNKITRFGFLSPNELIVGAQDPLWPSGVDGVISFLVLLGALLLVRVLCSLRAPSPALRLILLFGSLQFAYLIATAGIGFDRHMLILFPTLVLLVAGSTLRERSPVRFVFVPALSILALYSITGTHDWHAVSRAAARASTALVESGVAPDHIDAGYAQTGWMAYEQSLAELREGLPARSRSGDAWYIRSLYPRVETRYVVSLSETLDAERWVPALSPWARSFALLPRLDDYVPVDTEPFFRFWPPGEDHLLVVRDRRIP